MGRQNGWFTKRDKTDLVRRCREGYESLKSLRQRKEDLAAAQAAPHPA